MKPSGRELELRARREAAYDEQQELLAEYERRQRKPADAASRNPPLRESRNPVTASRNPLSRKSEPTESRNGRPPIGDRAMTAAERQRRKRAAKRPAEAGR
jgi:hypothetical protein